MTDSFLKDRLSRGCRHATNRLRCSNNYGTSNEIQCPKILCLKKNSLKITSKLLMDSNDTELAEMKEYPYLGVTLTSNLTWYPHLIKWLQNQTKLLALYKEICTHVRRMFKNLSYKTRVRPSMEYCGSVWDPSTKELKKEK